MTVARQQDEINRQIAHMTKNLEMVTGQIGRLTEDLTDIKLNRPTASRKHRKIDG
jgi:hypothetical protein